MGQRAVGVGVGMEKWACQWDHEHWLFRKLLHSNCEEWNTHCDVGGASAGFTKASDPLLRLCHKCRGRSHEDMLATRQPTTALTWARPCSCAASWFWLCHWARMLARSHDQSCESLGLCWVDLGPQWEHQWLPSQGCACVPQSAAPARVPSACQPRGPWMSALHELGPCAEICAAATLSLFATGGPRHPLGCLCW